MTTMMYRSFSILMHLLSFVSIIQPGTSQTASQSGSNVLPTQSRSPASSGLLGGGGGGPPAKYWHGWGRVEKLFVL